MIIQITEEQFNNNCIDMLEIYQEDLIKAVLKMQKRIEEVRRKYYVEKEEKE